MQDLTLAENNSYVNGINCTDALCNKQLPQQGHDDP